MGLGAPWTDGDPALGVFPERAPATRRWCFADQLGPHVLDDPAQPVLLVESQAVFARRRFHRQKAHLVLSALRHRAAELGDRAEHHRVRTYGEALDRCRDPLSVCAPTTWSSRDHVLGRPGLQVLAARGCRPGWPSWTPPPSTPPACPTSSPTCAATGGCTTSRG